MKRQINNKQIQELKVKIGELENNWKRALADYKNLEQRVREQRSEWARMAESGVIVKLLPILDDLNLAIKHRVKDDGIRMLKGKFLEVLRQMGVTEVDPAGEKYDPVTMECMEVTEGRKDVVVNTIFPGYKIYDKIIRAAKVTVGNGEAVSR